MEKSFSKRLTGAIVIGVMFIGTLSLLQVAQAAIQRVKFQAGTNYLIVEFLKDDLAHFELSGIGAGPPADKPIFTTPQVDKTDYAGPTSFAQSGPGGNTLDTIQGGENRYLHPVCASEKEGTKRLPPG